MTNREKAIKMVTELMNKENNFLHEVLISYLDICSNNDKKKLTDWCVPNNGNWCSSRNNEDCDNCFNKWADEEYIEPVPELKVGTFVGVGFKTYGVIVSDDNGNLSAVYESGGWDTLDRIKNEITYVFNENCKCFNGCCSENIKWRRY